MRRASTIIAFAVLLSLAPTIARAQPRIRLYTFGPGDSVPERFGHSALRVTDGDEDILYNLGHPQQDPGGVGFYVALAQGRTPFVGTAREAEAAIARYRDVDRTIRYQTLVLSPERARWLAGWLRHEVGGGLFHYDYDYLRDNCTTEIRDLLDEATDGALRRTAERAPPGPTYRQLTSDGFRGDFPTLLGSDLLTGPANDVPITRWQELFLPAPLHDTVADVPDFVSASEVVYARRGPPVHRGSPYVARIAIFVLSLSLFLLLVGARRYPRLTRGAGVVLFHVAPMIAMTGLGVWFLMATSTLVDLTWNENAIVMWPTDLLLLVPAVSWIRKREPPRRFFRAYLSLRLFGIACLIGAKLAGLAIQDNASFIASTVLVLTGVLVRLSPMLQKRVAT